MIKSNHQEGKKSYSQNRMLNKIRNVWDLSYRVLKFWWLRGLCLLGWVWMIEKPMLVWTDRPIVNAKILNWVAQIFCASLQKVRPGPNKKALIEKLTHVWLPRVVRELFTSPRRSEWKKDQSRTYKIHKNINN